MSPAAATEVVIVVVVFLEPQETTRCPSGENVTARLASPFAFMVDSIGSIVPARDVQHHHQSLRRIYGRRWSRQPIFDALIPGVENVQRISVSYKGQENAYGTAGSVDSFGSLELVNSGGAKSALDERRRIQIREVETVQRIRGPEQQDSTVLDFPPSQGIAYYTTWPTIHDEGLLQEREHGVFI
ncbi:hypothetical protein FPV67DRAFT_1443300 [Lyophyllum atratum]|nr:hypothetical protein FPV67DRAFT_1443300 [Lyophyllum atratum]